MSDQHLEDLSEEGLWRLVVVGSLSAFEEFVRRHQSAVASVAYSICGDVTFSEDIAQEALLTAWRTSGCLKDLQKSRAWVCGIARNLALGEFRRTRRHTVSLQSLRSDDEPATAPATVSDAVVREEEESVVWKTLEEIPAGYRESLILFYREEQSIAAIAQTLDITEEAARQRLSRGRELLRQQVVAAIEGTLSKTRPSAAFTASVMAATAVLSGTSKAAVATGGVGATGSMIAGSATSVLTAGTAGGLIGGLAGAAGGIGGAWLGSWIPAQVAPTNRERLHLLKSGKRMAKAATAGTLLFTALIFGLVHWQAPGIWIAAASVIFMIAVQTLAIIESQRMRREIRQIRGETTPEADPNPSVVGDRIRSRFRQYEGRVWQSKSGFLGRPWIDVNVADPEINGNPDGNSRPSHRVARGWIAVGDRANGILLAVGGRAYGIVAIGGVSLGLLSIGGLSIGVVSFGGLALGIAAVGGASFGGLALGGLAVGCQALGGFALAWDFACGGGAAAIRWAYGGAAWAGEAAVGGGANAPVVNTPEVRQMMEAHWLVRTLKWQVANNWLFVILITTVSTLPSLLLIRLLYRRKQGT